MNQAAIHQMAARAAVDRYQLAHQKNAACVVCAKPIDDPATALLLEQNDRLAHSGACASEALRHQFAFARRGLKGLRTIRSGR